MSRYSIETIKKMAVTERDFLILEIINARASNPSAPIAPIAGKLGSNVQQVASIYHHYMKGNMLWFSVEDSLLKKLFLEGKSDKDIADALKTSSGRVQKRRVSLGLTKHEKVSDEEQLVYQIAQCISKNLSTKEAAKSLGMSVGKISNYCRKHGMSFRKYGSDNHCSKVNAYDRALICTLRDKGYLPEHISKVVDHGLRTIHSVIYNTPSTSTIDLTKNEKAMKLLNCEINAGHHITPAEVELFNNSGIDEYMKKTGRSEQAAMATFVYRNQQRKYEQFRA